MQRSAKRSAPPKWRRAALRTDASRELALWVTRYIIPSTERQQPCRIGVRRVPIDVVNL